MKVPEKDAYGIKRLESKNIRNAIIQKISEDFNLTPIIAEAYFSQISSYFQQHVGIELKSGQIAYEAVSADEPPSKHIVLCEKITAKLTLIDLNSDLQVLAESGLAGLRRHRLLRISKQAYDQGALLNQLDLALLLNCCDAVVSQYVNEYQRTSKKILPTRGNIHDLSGAITHKSEIIALYLQGYLTPTIADKTNHSKESVDRYIRDFEAVRTVFNHGISDLDEIVQITKLSKKVAQQYVDLLPKDY